MTDTTTAAATVIAAEAKSTFSLADRLRGVKLTTRKVVVFADEDAVKAYTEASADLAAAESLLGKAQADDQASLAARAEELTAAKAAARTAMLSSALSIHMRAVPDVVMDRGRRLARKAYAVDGVIADDKLEDANTHQQQYVLGHVIHKIVDASGAEAEFDKATVAADLRESLPLSQWSRILRTYSEIVFTDQIGDQATLDPGF